MLKLRCLDVHKFRRPDSDVQMSIPIAFVPIIFVPFTLFPSKHINFIISFGAVERSSASGLERSRAPGLQGSSA